MPKRRAIYSTDYQTAIEFPPPCPEPVAPAPTNAVAEATQEPKYHTTIGKVDTYDNRTRTWILREPDGSKMAEITTKRDANKLADLLNRVMGGEHGQAR